MRSIYQGCVMSLGLCLAFPIWCSDDAVADAAANYSTQTIKQSSSVCVDYDFNLEVPQFEPEATYAGLNQGIIGSKESQISRVLADGAQAKLNRNSSTTLSTKSVAVTPGLSSPFKRKPMTSGISMEIGWPSMAASASIPPTPQPSTPRPLIIVV